jgi:hypothetical protein
MKVTFRPGPMEITTLGLGGAAATKAEASLTALGRTSPLVSERSMSRYLH